MKNRSIGDRTRDDMRIVGVKIRTEEFGVGPNISDVRAKVRVDYANSPANSFILESLGDACLWVKIARLVYEGEDVFDWENELYEIGT